MDLTQRKRHERRRMAQLRGRIDASTAGEAARSVAGHLEGSPELRRARRVVLYAALPDELPSRPLFQVVLASGKPILLPRVRGDGALEFVRCLGWEELEPGRYGVPEPPAGRAGVMLGVGDLVLVPGVAFDTHGNRLGRGKGHWDRALGRGARGVIVGVCYALQLIEAVPHGPEDRPMDAILSERGWHRVPKAG